MFARLFALPCLFLICLMTLMASAPAQAVGLPGLLGSPAKTQPEAQEPLGQSLDEVIKSLENDQQRSKLLADLKKLRDATKKAQPVAEEGVLGLIGGTLASFEKQFSGADSPITRWSNEFDLAKDELTALVLPASEWLPIIFAFAMILMVWSLLAAVLIWVSHRVRMRFGLTDGQPKTLDEIGKVYGVTRERIRQIESKTMSKLRHPSRSQVLRDYLD